MCLQIKLHNSNWPEFLTYNTMWDTISYTKVEILQSWVAEMLFMDGIWQLCMDVFAYLWHGKGCKIFFKFHCVIKDLMAHCRSVHVYMSQRRAILARKPCFILLHCIVLETSSHIVWSTLINITIYFIINCVSWRVDEHSYWVIFFLFFFHWLVLA